MANAREILDDVTYVDDAYECARGADALVIVTEWDAFRALDLDRIRSLLTRPIVVDLRNIYRADEMKARGFSYISVGRPVAERAGRLVEDRAELVSVRAH